MKLGGTPLWTTSRGSMLLVHRERDGGVVVRHCVLGGLASRGGKVDRSFHRPRAVLRQRKDERVHSIDQIDRGCGAVRSRYLQSSTQVLPVELLIIDARSERLAGQGIHQTHRNLGRRVGPVKGQILPLQGLPVVVRRQEQRRRRVVAWDNIGTVPVAIPVTIPIAVAVSIVVSSGDVGHGAVRVNLEDGLPHGDTQLGRHPDVPLPFVQMERVGAGQDLAALDAVEPVAVGEHKHIAPHRDIVDGVGGAGAQRRREDRPTSPNRQQHSSRQRNDR